MFNVKKYLKDKAIKLSDVFVSSDFHAFHKNICAGVSDWKDKSRCRQYLTAEEMNGDIIHEVNQKVPENGLLIHLGDWSFGGKDKIELFRDRLHCRHIINLYGNHDHHIENDKELRRRCFVHCGHYLEFRVQGTLVTMCHYPIASWHKIGGGAINLHGHCHGTFKGLPRQTDVGIDVRPVSRLVDLVDELSSNEIVLVDHHDKDS